MKTQKLIRLQTSGVNDFVNVAENCSFEIDIANQGYERRVVDAKSYLGIMSLDLTRPLMLTYDGDDLALNDFIDAHQA